ncbi:MAG: hypothetical protein ACKO0Z_28820, partial [Betaproteobacteria bacterium]
SEFAVLVVARHWSQPVEWHIHKPIAMQAGVSEETCDAIAKFRIHQVIATITNENRRGIAGKQLMQCLGSDEMLAAHRGGYP